MRAPQKCSQNSCSEPPVVRFAWPGRDEMGACLAHQLLVARVANAMGLHVQFLPLKAKADDEEVQS